METKTQFAPMVLLPLPMHSGLVVFGLALTAVLAVCIVIHMFRASNNREIF